MYILHKDHLINLNKVISIHISDYTLAFTFDDEVCVNVEVKSYEVAKIIMNKLAEYLQARGLFIGEIED